MISQTISKIRSLLVSKPKPELTLQDKLNKFCTKEVKLIDNIFRERKLRGVYVADVTASEIAGYIRYHVHRPISVEVSKVSKLRKDIAATLTANRPNDNDVTVKINEVQMIIEVEYPFKRAPLDWSIAPLESLRPMDMIVGRSYEGTTASAIKLNLRDKTVPNLGIFALPGSGKTQAVVQAVASAAYATSPDELKFIVLDPKFSPELEALADVKHVEWITEPEDCQQAVFNLKSELDRRKRNRDNRKIILVIDELAEFFRENDDSGIVVALRSIAALGRQLNVHMLVATQYPTVKATDSELRNLIDMRMGGHVGDEIQSRVAMGIGDVGCESLPGAGAFYFKDQHSKVRRINTHYLPEEDIPHFAERINYKWRNAETWPLAQAVRQQEGRQSGESVTGEQVDLILESYEIDELVKPNGKLVWGMGNNLVRLVFGDDVDAEGSGTYKRWKANLPIALTSHMQSTTQ